MALTGAWVRANQVTPGVPLVAGLDPEHGAPTATPEFVHTAPAWRNTAPAPLLPSDVTTPPDQQDPSVGGGPLDYTPLDHGYGVGVGPGLTTLESQDRMGVWHDRDTGTVAAESYAPLTTRDGSWNLAVIPDMVGDGDSPHSVDLQRTGVGVASDQGRSRVAKRYKRWVQRYIDMHRFTPQPRPSVAKYANPANVSPAVPAGTQLDSPWVSANGAWPGSRDQFVTPMMRRSPQPWDQDSTTDGTPDTVAGAAAGYGLTAWGM